MWRSVTRAMLLTALLLTGAVQAQTQPRPPAAGMPPGDEGLTRGALTHSLLAISYGDLNKRAVTMAGLSTAADARQRQTWVRTTIVDLIGGLPGRTAPLNAQVTRTSAGDGFRVENIIFESLPGMRVTANLYLPANTGGKYPAIVAFPGHGPLGKLGYYSFGVFMARQGIAVLAIDLPGEGEMLQYNGTTAGKPLIDRATTEHGMDAFAVAVTGDHVARYFINNGMRAIDYLASRADMDAANIGVYGCSGGGTIATYVAGLDPRVKATAIACFMNDFAHLLPVQGPQEAEQTIPRFVSSGLDLPDWMELAAPKPYAIVATTEDFFPFTGARAAFDEGRRFWGLLGAPDNLVFIYGPGGHGNLGPLQNQIADFFHGALGGQEGGLRRPPPPFAAPEDWVAKLQVTDTGQVATAFRGETIQSINAARAGEVAAKPALVGNAGQAAALNARLAVIARNRAAITAVAGDPARVEMADHGASADDRLIHEFTFESWFGSLPAALVSSDSGPPRPTMVLMEDGKLDPRSGIVIALVNAGWNVLAIQARGADGIERGGADLLGNQNRMALRAFIAGRTLPGIRADDLIAAINWLKPEGRRISLMATGSATVAAAHVALIDNRVGTLVLSGGLISWRNAVSLPMQRDLAPNIVPGALRDFDLPDLITATAACRVTIVDPVDGMREPLAMPAIRAAYAPALAWHGDRLRIVTGQPRWVPEPFECPA